MDALELCDLVALCRPLPRCVAVDHLAFHLVRHGLTRYRVTPVHELSSDQNTTTRVMQMLETIETEITEFIADRVKERIETITPEDRLLEDGIIDSLSLLDLVTFIEKTYRVVVDDFDIDLETFGSVRSIAKYVSAKRD